MKANAKSATPPPPFVGKLATIAAIRREMGRLYRAARWGELAVTDATRLAYVLKLLADLIEADDLERRLADLEGRMMGRRTS